MIDTDWVIDHFNSRGPVTTRLIQLEPQGLAISVITLAELWEGVIFSRDRRRSEEMLLEFVANVSVIGVDEEICRHFGRIRGTLRKRGTPVGDLDVLIACTSLRHNLTLLTNNRKHFERVEGLQIESV